MSVPEGNEDISIGYNGYNHLTFTLENTPGTDGETPGMRIHVRAHPDVPVAQEQQHAFYDVRGSSLGIKQYRDNMSKWLWNAAAAGSQHATTRTPSTSSLWKPMAKSAIVTMSSRKGVRSIPGQCELPPVCNF